MRNTRRTENQVPARRAPHLRAAWLLVCMLPYFLFALLGEGMHTDHFASNGSERGRTTSTAAATHGAQAGFASVVVGYHVDRDATCLACEWSANSTAVIPLLQPQPSPSLEMGRIAEPVTMLWTSRSTALALGRGPPTV